MLENPQNVLGVSNNFDSRSFALQFVERCNAGTPADVKAISAWLELRQRQWLEALAKGKAAFPPGVEGSPEDAARFATQQQIVDTIAGTEYAHKLRLAQLEAAKAAGEEVGDEEEKAAGWSVFRKDEVGLYLEARQFKALLREAAKGLGVTARPPLGATQDVREYCHVWATGQHPLDPRAARLYFSAAPDRLVPLQEPDGSHERPICVTGPQGKRSALKRSDFMVQRWLFISVEILNSRNSRPSEHEFRLMLDLMQRIGLGADRSQGYGQFQIQAYTSNVAHVLHELHRREAKEVKGKKGKKDVAPTGPEAQE